MVTTGEDVGNLVLKDREMLGENGIVIVSCTLDRATKKNCWWTRNIN